MSILPDDMAPLETRFLLGASRERMGRSFAASLGSHVLGIALVALILGLAPERVYEVVEADRQNDSIVWLADESLGGGGGGGGKELLELPSQVQFEGPVEAQRSLPVEDPPEVGEPATEPELETLEARQLSIPPTSMAFAFDTRAGMLEGLMAAMLSQASGGAGSGDGGGAGPGQGGGVGGGVYRPGAGINLPRLLREVKPQYTPEAMRAKIQGTVVLEVVVLPDGTIGDVRVTKSLDPVFGLDAQAIAAARQWRFTPGTRFGEPVAVALAIELFFNLR